MKGNKEEVGALKLITPGRENDITLCLTKSLSKTSFNRLSNGSYTSTHKTHFGSEFNPVFSDFAKDSSLLQDAGAKLM